MFRSRSRRSFSFSRAPFRRRRFQGVNNRKVSQPVKWEWANFSFANVIAPEGAFAAQNIVTLVAAMDDRLGDSGTAQGRALMHAARRLELGGIVWYAGVDVQQITPANRTAEMVRERHMVWAFDRLDATGIPVAINTDWAASDPPIATIDATNPAATIDEAQYPQRIIRRWTEQASYGIFLSADSAVSTVHNRSRWSGNLRLRQFLDEDHCLVFHQFNHNRVGVFASAAVRERFWCTGTLYYRWRF